MMQPLYVSTESNSDGHHGHSGQAGRGISVCWNPDLSQSEQPTMCTIFLLFNYVRLC